MMIQFQGSNSSRGSVEGGRDQLFQRAAAGKLMTLDSCLVFAPFQPLITQILISQPQFITQLTTTTTTTTILFLYLLFVCGETRNVESQWVEFESHMGLGVFFVIVAERKRLGNIASEDDVYVRITKLQKEIECIQCLVARLSMSCKLILKKLK